MENARRKRTWIRALPWVAVFASLAGVLALAFLSRVPPDPLREGREAYARRDWEQARRTARDVAAGDPENEAALRLLARSAARLGQDEVAQNLFLRLGSGEAEAEDFFLLGTTLDRQGQTTQAVSMIERALGLDPKHAETLAALAGLYRRMDRLSEATALAGRLAAVPGWARRGNALLGELRLAAGEPERAAQALGVSLGAQGGAPLDGEALRDARARAAEALLASGRPAEAMTHIDAALGAGADPLASWLASRAHLQLGDRDAALAALRAAGSIGVDRPEPAPYVGAARCGECHAEIHRTQQSSRHARTFRHAGEVADLELPAQPLDDPVVPGVVHRIEPAEGGVRLRTDADGSTREALIAYVLGSGRHARTPIGKDSDGSLRELRLTHYAAIDGWDRTPGHPERPAHPADLLGEPQSADAIRRCLGCHTTHYLAATDPDRPEAADRGIGCETCHGPGGNHAAAVALDFPEPAIRSLNDLPESEVVKLCGRCHGTAGRGVAEGDAFLALRFQAATLTWSRCYQESGGRFGCLTCHSAHGDAATSAVAYESRCLGCHAPAGADGGSAAQTPCPVNPARDCLGCHMPLLQSPMPHARFTDHYIRVRRDDPTAAPGAGSRPSDPQRTE